VKVIINRGVAAGQAKAKFAAPLRCMLLTFSIAASVTDLIADICPRRAVGEGHTSRGVRRDTIFAAD